MNILIALAKFPVRMIADTQFMTLKMVIFANRPRRLRQTKTAELPSNGCVSSLFLGSVAFVL